MQIFIINTETDFLERIVKKIVLCTEKKTTQVEKWTIFMAKKKLYKKKNNSNKKRKNSQLDQAKALSLESNSWDSP